MASEKAQTQQGEENTDASVRRTSFSGQSDNSQTAAEFLRDQELLEADAREALPYSIESCTKILGPLRQNVFACLTCNPAPSGSSDSWKPAGVCYACSVQCHGEHTLVEIFQKRNFTCDCGTTRIPSTDPCTLRTNNETNTRGNVHSEQPDDNNKYNHNFRNRFCGCQCDYDPFQQKGTMFQCLGLGTHETGGCGEDWYHPGCLVGMGPAWFEKMKSRPISKPATVTAAKNGLPTISEDAADSVGANGGNDSAIDDDELPLPPGFPDEDAFDGFICYKCVDANPWIKQYAGTSGFLPAVHLQEKSEQPEGEALSAKKRKAEDEDDGNEQDQDRMSVKRAKSETGIETEIPIRVTGDSEAVKEELPCKLGNLPAATTGQFSLFFKDDFRDKFCRCHSCYRKLNEHPQLLEEEEVYEPPMSEDGESQHGGSTHGSGSLLERGESALRNVDRVRAIEGVMAYNHLKERLKPFFQQFANSGQAIGAEDIKAYFAKLRGDEQGIKEAGEAAAREGDNGDANDGRKEQRGF